MAYEIIWEKHGIRFRNYGTVTHQEVMECNDQMYGDPRYEKIMYQISDYTDVTNNLLTGKEAEIIGTLDRSSSVWNNKMLNIVVTKDPDFIPLVEKYFGKLVETNWQCRLFGELDEAYRWIRERLDLAE